MKKFLLWLARCLPVIFALTLSVRASDVAIGPATIPGFNAANLPPDVTLTGVSVVSGNPVVTCASCFRQQWVGLGGFRIVINAVPYTVKFVSSRGALTLTTNYAAGDSSNATVLWYKYVELRIYADSAFQPLGKTYIVQPGAPGSGAWHRRIAASVVNEFGVNNLYIPELSGAQSLDATTDSLTNQGARYFAGFYRPEGGLIQPYDCFDSFALPPTGATSWGDICMFNSRFVPVTDTLTYTARQIDAMRTGCTTGQGLFYAATGLKPDCLNFGSGLALVGSTLTATAPSGYTTVQNNGTPLTQRGTLNFVAPAFVASDNGGATRTDVTAHAQLISLANLATNGGVFRTAANTLTARTLTGTTNRITVTNGDGVAGAPTFDVGSTVATSGNNLSFFAATTSAQLAGLISDESGSGLLVFGTSPTLGTPTLNSPRVTPAIFDTNGNEILGIIGTGGAVNELSASNAATGGRPKLSATGGDTNIGLELVAKGTGDILTFNPLTVASNATATFTLNNTTAVKAMVSSVSNTGVWTVNSLGAGDITTTDLSTRVQTFTQIPVLPASNPTTANQAARKQYVDDSTTAFSACWFYAVLPGAVETTESVGRWVVPVGQDITVTSVTGVWAAGADSGASNVFTIKRRNSAGTAQADVGTVDINTPAQNVLQSGAVSVALTAGDQLYSLFTTRNTASETLVTVCVRGTQKRIP